MVIFRGALSNAKLINYKLLANVAKGDILQINNVVGIALHSGTFGEVIPVVIEADLVEWPCDLGNYSAGEKVYFDTSTNKVNKVTTGIPEGYVYESKQNATTIEMVLN